MSASTAVRRILVVDDSSTIRTIVKAAIEMNAPKGTVQVVESAGADQAFAELEAAAFDLMVIDWNMPRVDGLTVIRQLRARGNEIPVIMVSAVADAAHVAEAQRAGVADYVTKPFSMAELWSRIAPHLPR